MFIYPTVNKDSLLNRYISNKDSLLNRYIIYLFNKDSLLTGGMRLSQYKELIDHLVTYGQEPPPVIAFHGCSWTNSQEICGQISGGRYVKGDVG